MKKNPDSKSGPLVHVIGSNQLQNDLLVSYLEKETGLKCSCGPAIHMTSSKTNNPDRKHLVLLDCQAIEFDDIKNKLGEGNANPARCFVALFNVDPEKGIEKKAVDRGIRGIFYKNEPRKYLPKGVRAILNGELWYSRKTMSECLLVSNSFSELAGETIAILTPREKEILTNVASGASNKEIAANLNISLHTVKKHIANIYKKIKVCRRLQATLWAAKHL